MKKRQRLIATLLAIALTLQVTPGWTMQAKPTPQACYDMLDSAPEPTSTAAQHAERIINEAAKNSTRDRAIYALVLVLGLSSLPTFSDGFSLSQDFYGRCYVDTQILEKQTKEPETPTEKPPVNRMSGEATGVMIPPITADVHLPVIPPLAHLIGSECAQPNRPPGNSERESEDIRTNPYLPLREARESVVNYLSSQSNIGAAYEALKTVITYSAIALVLGASGYAVHRGVKLVREGADIARKAACLGAVCVATDTLTNGRLSGFFSPRRPRN